MFLGSTTFAFLLCDKTAAAMDSFGFPGQCSTTGANEYAVEMCREPWMVLTSQTPAGHGSTCLTDCANTYADVFLVYAEAHGPDLCVPMGRFDQLSRQYDMMLTDLVVETVGSGDQRCCKCSYNATMRSYKDAWADDMDICSPEHIADRLSWQAPNWLVRSFGTHAEHIACDSPFPMGPRETAPFCYLRFEERLEFRMDPLWEAQTIQRDLHLHCSTDLVGQTVLSVYNARLREFQQQ